MDTPFDRFLNLSFDSPLGNAHLSAYEGHPDKLYLNIYSEDREGQIYRGISFRDICATASRKPDNVWQLDKTEIVRGYPRPPKALSNKDRRTIQNALLEIANQWWMTVDINELERLELEKEQVEIEEEIEDYEEMIMKREKDLREIKQKIKKLTPATKTEGSPPKSALGELLKSS